MSNNILTESGAKTGAKSASTSKVNSLDLKDHVTVKVKEDITEHGGSPDSKIRFLRVEVQDVTPAVEAIIEAIADTSWISSLVDNTVRQGFSKCAEDTIKKLTDDLTKAIGKGATSDIGEYVVSVVARYIIEAVYNYKALPLAELIKEKESGNPGFDYHHENDSLVLVFGEAKYIAGKNAHNSALKQIVDFIQAGKDTRELTTLSHFLAEETKTNLEAGKRGYSAAFSTSSKSFDSKKLLKTLKGNIYFKKLLHHEELLVVAVDING